MDAGFHTDEVNASIGAVVRDSHGTFVAAKNDKIDYVIDAAMAEAIALRHDIWMWSCHC
jgi:hypothetical protein